MSISSIASSLKSGLSSIEGDIEKAEVASTNASATTAATFMPSITPKEENLTTGSSSVQPQQPLTLSNVLGDADTDDTDDAEGA
jgi:hypothetical protein